MADLFDRFMRFGRTVARRRGFFSLAVASLSLGVGAATAIFTLVYSALLRPAPFPHGSELVSIGHVTRPANFRLGVSAPAFRYYTNESKLLGGAALVGQWNPTWSTRGEPRRLRGARVSPSYFGLLGGAMTLGRGFTSSEGVFGEDRVVVISTAMWESDFGRDPAIIGRPIMLDGVSRVVVGVVPFGDEVMEGGTVDIWTPLALGEADFAPEFWGREHYRMIARLKAGLDQLALDREMQRIEGNVRAAGLRNDTWSTWATPLGEQARGQWRPALWLLLAATGLLLLITCSNVAGLYLARLQSLLQEASVRAALGATPRRLIRAALTESLGVAVCGGAIGYLLGHLTIRAFRPTIQSVLVGIRPPTASVAVLLFCVSAVAIVGVVIGLVPGLHLSRHDLTSSMRRGQRGASDSKTWAQDALIIGEVGLAVALSICAVTVSQSFRNLSKVELGYEPEPVAIAGVELPLPRYLGVANQSQFADRVRAELLATPGIRSAGVGVGLPQGPMSPTASFDVRDRARGSQEQEPWGDFAAVSPGLMESLGFRLIAGRFFNELDQAGSTPVAIVDEELARAYWPNESALHRYITSGIGPVVWHEIVGVVRHVRRSGPLEEVHSQRYFPLSQVAIPQLTMVARFSPEQRPDPGVFRRALQRVDPTLAIIDPSRLAERAARALGRSRLLAMLFGAFATLATLFASVGVFVVVARAVERRRLEFGIRLALGAQADSLARATLAHGAKLGAIGVLLGVPLSVLLLQSSGDLLHGVGVFSLRLVLGVALFAIALAASAAWLPAKRATLVDPQTCLRGVEGA